MTRVLGLGDNVVDVYLHTNVMYPGGNSLNFAVYSHLLGYEAGYMGVLGDDAPAAHVYQVASDLGLDLSHCRFHCGENGLARVTLIDGDRVFLPSNKGGISKFHPIELSKLDERYIQGFDLVHTSRFSYTENLLPQLKSLGARVSFDFSHMHPPEYLEQLCPHIFCAALSCGHMGDTEIEQLMQMVHQLGPYLVLATRGARGALLLAGGEFYEQSPCLVQATDTLGAGDSFLAAFLCSYVDGMKYAADFPMAGGDKGLTTMKDYERSLIRVSLHKAAVFSSQSCLQSGAFGCGTEFKL